MDQALMAVGGAFFPGGPGGGVYRPYEQPLKQAYSVTPGGPGGGVYHPAAAGVPAAGSAAAAWVPPPIPEGTYTPLRDIELAEGKKGTQQAESGYERERTNAENTYGTNLAQLGEREANERRQRGETLDRLRESFQRLGGRQADQGSATGTLYGGALIAAAQKRAANEQLQQKSIDARSHEQEQSNANQRGQLATGLGQLVGPGGSLTEAMQNARLNEGTFEQGINTLKGSEAARAGYKAPTHPLVVKAKKSKGKH